MIFKKDFFWCLAWVLCLALFPNCRCSNNSSSREETVPVPIDESSEEMSDDSDLGIENNEGVREGVDDESLKENELGRDSDLMGGKGVGPLPDATKESPDEQAIGKSTESPTQEVPQPATKPREQPSPSSSEATIKKNN